MKVVTIEKAKKLIKSGKIDLDYNKPNSLEKFLIKRDGYYITADYYFDRYTGKEKEKVCRQEVYVEAPSIVFKEEAGKYVLYFISRLGGVFTEDIAYYFDSTDDIIKFLCRYSPEIVSY